MRMRDLINNHHHSINQSDDCILVDVMSSTNQIAAFGHVMSSTNQIATHHCACGNKYLGEKI